MTKLEYAVERYQEALREAGRLQKAGKNLEGTIEGIERELHALAAQSEEANKVVQSRYQEVQTLIAGDYQEQQQSIWNSGWWWRWLKKGKL